MPLDLEYNDNHTRLTETPPEFNGLISILNMQLFFLVNIAHFIKNFERLNVRNISFLKADVSETLFTLNGVNIFERFSYGYLDNMMNASELEREFLSENGYFEAFRLFDHIREFRSENAFFEAFRLFDHIRGFRSENAFFEAFRLFDHIRGFRSENAFFEAFRLFDHIRGFRSKNAFFETFRLFDHIRELRLENAFFETFRLFDNIREFRWESGFFEPFRLFDHIRGFRSESGFFEPFHLFDHIREFRLENAKPTIFACQEAMARPNITLGTTLKDTNDVVKTQVEFRYHGLTEYLIKN
ncbi:unnamed protein product [Angiostrongylus costaricensis]|uniref:Uncharacterized protein n=1 Tax=Angiostrongylus costaricensis TaxID=334426 RepID=A0A158PK28_ANGCS|nr:unnamed protein product [Angiostrongylus costaricensis]